MKIINNAKVKGSQQFKNLKPGDLFEYCGNHLLKIDRRDGIDAVNIETGTGHSVDPGWLVETVFSSAVLYLHGAPNE